MITDKWIIVQKIYYSSVKSLPHAAITITISTLVPIVEQYFKSFKKFPFFNTKLLPLYVYVITDIDQGPREFGLYNYLE